MDVKSCEIRADRFARYVTVVRSSLAARDGQMCDETAFLGILQTNLSPVELRDLLDESQTQAGTLFS